MKNKDSEILQIQYEIAKRQALEQGKNDPVFFIEKFVCIEDRDSEEIIVPFQLWPQQKEALYGIHKNRLNIILKARQLGMTWLALGYAAWCMRFKKGFQVIALSRTESEAKELVRRLDVIFGNLKEAAVEYEKSVLKIELANGSSFIAFTSAPGVGRSFTANLVLLDEWAFQQYAREIWTSAYPTINRPTGGKVIGLSTIERGTLFEDIWCGDFGFNKIFLPWTADPRRSVAWYEATKKAMGDMIMQEYPATPEEALTIPGGAFFPEFKPHTHIVEEGDLEGLSRYVSIDYGLDMFAVLFYAVDLSENVLVYREIYESGLVVPKAAQRLLDVIGEEEVDAIYAPPDLWNRNRDTGRSTFEVFADYGLFLSRTSNIREQGCMNIKEYLNPVSQINDQTGEVKVLPRLRVLKDAAPNLVRCLTKIQRDDKKPNEYANTPHELTHIVDSLRAFCMGRPAPQMVIQREDELEIDDQIQEFLELGR